MKVIEKIWATKRLKAIQRRADKRNLDFDLDNEWLVSQTNRGCNITGESFDLWEQDAKLRPSVDRIDNNKGYTKDNCQVIQQGLNAAKGTMDNKEFMLSNRVCDLISHKSQKPVQVTKIAQDYYIFE